MLEIRLWGHNLMRIFLKTCFFSSFIAFSAIGATVVDVAIIGSGCGGLGAANITAEFGYNTLVFSGPYRGGDLNVDTVVGNWLGIKTTKGDKIIPIVEKNATKFGAKIIDAEIASVDFSKSPLQLIDRSGAVYQAKKIVIATGTKDRLVQANIPNPKGRIYYNWDVHSDLSKFKDQVAGKDVSIIGGGVDAMKKSFYAIRSRAEKVNIYTRSNRMRTPSWRTSLISRMPNAHIYYNYPLKKIEGNGQKLRLHFENGESKETDIAIISVGRVPNTSLFKNKLKIDSKGFIVVDAKTQKTSLPHVFACGDVTDASGPQPQAMIAAGNGMIAGFSVVEELLKEGVAPQNNLSMRIFF